MKNPKNIPQRWILVTGLSGSGKSTALKTLEDQGFFAIDNLPAALLEPFIRLAHQSKDIYPQVALGMDLREKDFAKIYLQVLHTLEGSGIPIEVLFLESKAKILIQRFSESRRRHPLQSTEKTLESAILKEKELLAPIRLQATKIIETSALHAYQLKSLLHQYLESSASLKSFPVLLTSFGFKYGIPEEADMIFDVRFLKNPYFDPKLSSQPGTSKAVKKFILEQTEAKQFLDRCKSLLKFLLPNFKKEGKSHLTIGFGCTGGRHRSVAIVEAMVPELAHPNWNILKIHRDLEKT